jgi:PAS domain S-box-containing protein
MSGDATLPFARAVRGADGQFLGVVSAAVRPTYFHDIYQLLDLGPGGGARLMQQTGVLMAGGGEAGGSIGENFSHTEAFKAGVANEAGAVLRHRGGADKAMRVSAVRPVRGYPLVVGVSMTQTHVLGHWHTQSRFIAPLAGALTLFLLGLSHFLSRALRTDAQLRHELDRVEERQRFAIEGAGHGVWDWDIPSDSVHRSGGYHRIFGLPETFPAEKHAWRDTVHPDDLPRAREAMVGMAKGDRTQISDEIRVRSPAGGWRHAIIRGTVVARDAAGKPLRVIGTVTDITELRSAQQRLQEGEARLAAIIDSAMDAVITVDANQHIVLFNAAAERFFGLRALDAVGQPLDRLIPERFRQAHGTHIAQFGATGVTTRRMGAKIVLAGLRANGEEFPIDASISQVTVSGQKFFTVILRDITARVAADAEIERSHHDLRELSRAANDALEGERRRVARELHDELGQQLTAMKIDIGELDKMVAAERPDMQERIARLRSLVDQTVASTRRISSDLRPLMLDDLGLGAALEWLVQSFQQRTGIRATLTLDDALAGIDEPHASAIFRIVQESLTNAARHSGANAVTIELAREDDEAIVRVRDNGRGLQEGDRDKRGSFGLLGMRERAKLLGGAATVENHAAGGAVVTARLPFAPLPSEVAAG